MASHPPHMGTGTCLRMFCSLISFCRSRLALVTMMSSTFCPLLGTSLTKNTRSSSSWMTNLHEGMPGMSVRHPPGDSPRWQAALPQTQLSSHHSMDLLSEAKHPALAFSFSPQLHAELLSKHTPCPTHPGFGSAPRQTLRIPQSGKEQQGSRQGVWSEGLCISVLFLLFTSCVTLGSSLYLSEPQSHHQG